MSKGRYSDEELIERLKGLYKHRGFLSGLVIDESDGMPSSSVYVHRFGSLIRAYQMVGFSPGRDYQYVEVNRLLRQMHPQILCETEARIAQLGGSVVRDPATDMLWVNDEFSASIVMARCNVGESGHCHWKIRLDTGLMPDISVAVRLQANNQEIRDYYLLPRIDIDLPRLSLAEQNGLELESYRFDTLDYLYGMACRARLRLAA